jgi:stage V sporulation protein S
MPSANGTNIVETSEFDESVALPVSAQQGAMGTSQLSRSDETDEPTSRTEVLKVSTRSRPSAVAGAIAGVLRQQDSVEMQSIGAGATNQAVKAIAIARVYLQDDGIDVWFVPSFIDVVIDGAERTALRLLIQRRSR